MKKKGLMIGGICLAAGGGNTGIQPRGCPRGFP